MPAGGADLNKLPAGLDRPVPRTTFAATAAATLPLSSKMPAALRTPATTKPPAPPAAAHEGETESSDKGEHTDTPVIPDWGLSRKKPRWGMKFKIGAAALTLVGAAGGYLAYSHFFANRPAGDDVAQNGAALTRSDSSNDFDPSVESPGKGDPFDDGLPKVRPATNSRTSSGKEPRRMETSPDATPIGGRTTATDRKPKNPLRENLALDDVIPEISDNSDPREPAPSELGRDDSDTAKALQDPASAPRRASSGIRNDSGPARSSVRQSRPASGPRLSTFGGDDNDLAEEPADDKLDGYRVAENRPKGNGKRSSAGPAISIVEAHDDLDQDEKLEGYEPQNGTTQRAYSKTIVVPATETGRRPVGDSGPGRMAGGRDPAARSTGFGEDDEIEEAPRAPGRDADEPFARPARGEFNTIQRRSSPPAPAADRQLTSSPPAGNPSPSGSPVSDTYRVAPDDNFWKISKKQYGTARYYQALMRCNQERVPDPQKLRPGTQILTPAAAVLEQRYPELIEKSAPGAPATSGATDRSAMRPAFEKPLPGDDAERPSSRVQGDAGAGGYFYGKAGEPLYRIGPDDTLTGIAQRHLGRASRWHEIYEKNQDVLPSPDNLTLGTVIRLPTDASRVGLAPDGDRRR